MRTPQDLPRRLPTSSRRFRIGLLIAIVAVIVLIASLRGLAGFYTDYLWFQSVGFTSVFRGVLLTKVLLSIVFIAIFFLLMFVNLTIADRYAPEEIDPGENDELVVRYRESVFPRGRIVRIAVSAVFALLAGTGADREWNNWDLFRYHTSFGIKDPQYGRDIGFYVFQLPFINFLLGWFFEAFVVVLIVTCVAHYLNGGIRLQSAQRGLTAAVKTHISVLLGILALIKAVDYYYERLELVLSRSHVVNGATATSVHADQPAKTLLIAIAIIAAILFLYNIRQKGWILPAVGVGLWALVYILVGLIYPALYQALRVNPSEFTREQAYIQRNINATQAAYGLLDTPKFGGSSIQVDQACATASSQSNCYQYVPTVTKAQIQGPSPAASAAQQTIANVRLLDPAVQLVNTFNRYQALRQYYQFNNLDLDRYQLDTTGTPEMTATVASVRELNSAVPGGFVNQHLTYTHGYGAVVAPIGQSGLNTTDGTPNFSLSNLPPQTTEQNLGLSADGSRIYYGEGPDTGGFVIADSKQPEVDYENSAGNTLTAKYGGTGGVKAGNLLRRAAFALRFGDPNFILSSQINQSSKVMYIRNIVSRAEKAAPFLKFDSDPYAVVLNGNVYWILDAYTTTDNYPYSQNANTDRVPPSSGLSSTFNYVRNSVKVVINAYNGSMKFFVVDPADPIIKVYEKAFPDLFTKGNPDSYINGITAHFRYPEDIFRVQTNMYGRYHLAKAQDFYSQAQAWAVSPDPGSGLLSNISSPATASIGPNGQIIPPSVQRLQPQYILAALPGSTTQSFMLLTPFVPIAATTNQQNLTGFMTASSDPDTYGQLRVYEAPPGSTVDGPGLVSNAIRSNQSISQELTLYDQKGSSVELGEVDIVPIDNTLLYVQTVYVESSSLQVPTLRDVVVVYNGTAYHSGNASLDNALCQIVNPDGTQPFSNYCNTAAATSVLPTAPASSPSGSGSSGSTSTTTTTPTTAPAGSTPAPPPNSTVKSLLAQAQADFVLANNALKASDLAGYQSYVMQAQNLVTEAQNLASKS
jgi:uncharacterized membrane protein (UPF0182 family)